MRAVVRVCRLGDFVKIIMLNIQGVEFVDFKLTVIMSCSIGAEFACAENKPDAS